MLTHRRRAPSAFQRSGRFPRLRGHRESLHAPSVQEPGACPARPQRATGAPRGPEFTDRSPRTVHGSGLPSPGGRPRRRKAAKRKCPHFGGHSPGRGGEPSRVMTTSSHRTRKKLEPVLLGLWAGAQTPPMPHTPSGRERPTPKPPLLRGPRCSAHPAPAALPARPPVRTSGRPPSPGPHAGPSR